MSTISLSQIHPVPGHRLAPQVQPCSAPSERSPACFASLARDGPPLRTRDPLAPLARRAEPGTPRCRASLTPASPAGADAKVTRLPLPSWPCAHLSWRRTRRRPVVLGCPSPGPRLR